MLPPLDSARLIEHVHGHAGWLAVAALAHPAIMLRKRTRLDLSIALSTAFVTLAGGLGAFLYVAYRERLKQHIFLEAPSIGLLFERKEHLAFGAVLLAWAGALAYFAAARAADEKLRATLRRTATRAFLGAAALTLVVAVLGTWVAVFHTF